MTVDRDLVEFNLVYGQAVELAKGFPDSQFKTLASLFVVIGWLLTAATAQAFIKAHASLALPGTIALFTLLIVFKGIWIAGYYERANTLHGRLATIANAQKLSMDTVETFKVTPLVPVTFFVVDLVTCIAIMTIVGLICA